MMRITKLGKEFGFGLVWWWESIIDRLTVCQNRKRILGSPNLLLKFSLIQRIFIKLCFMGHLLC